MSSSNCCFLTCIQVSQEASKVVWYSHYFKNFPQFLVIHTIKGFCIVNVAEIDVFLEFSCLLYNTIQFTSVAQSCRTLCNPMNCSIAGLPVHHQLPEFTQTHAHQVGDAIQPSHPLSSPSPPAPNPSQHQGLFQWVDSSHEVAKVLEFQLQHQSFQWIFRTDIL